MTAKKRTSVPEDKLLLYERLIEAVLRPRGDVLLLRCIWRQHHLGRIADPASEHEHEDQDAGEDQERVEETAQQIGSDGNPLGASLFRAGCTEVSQPGCAAPSSVVGATAAITSVTGPSRCPTCPRTMVQAVRIVKAILAGRVLPSGAVPYVA